MLRLLLVVSLCLLTGSASAADPASVDFFESKIRPVLISECYSCHSAESVTKKKLRGGLLLDTKPGMLAGGDTGPTFVKGKPAESMLVKSLHYAGDLKMPPKGKLPDGVIADFEAWIAAGATDPRDGAAPTKKQVGPSIAEGRKLWPYQPLKPSDKSIDDLIDARLAEAKQAPAVPATKGELLRRVTFDLTGLPPTPAELAAFEADADAKAYERAVDRLLASRGFGEHWGRHWLDVARYADSVTLRGLVFPDAWRYRNYVIDSFQADKPLDQLIREQIAGDLLDLPGLDAERNARIATTFLMLGNTNLEEQDKKALRMDVVDEQLDVVTRGFLAMTVTCARCHDHKFDPIPTKDYYALAGIFRNAKAMEHAGVSKWLDVPLPVPAADDAAYKAHEADVVSLTKVIALMKAKGGKPGAIAVAEVPGIVVDDEKAAKVGAWKASTYTGVYIGAGYVYSDITVKEEKSLTFTPEKLQPGKYEVLLSYSHSMSRASNAPATVFSADGETTITVDMKKTPPVEGRFVNLGEFRFEKDGQAHVIVSTEGTTGHVTADAVVFRSTAEAAEVAGKPSGDANAVAIKALETKLKTLKESGRKRPTVMSVVEEPKMEDARIHIRGSVHALGDATPRGVLSVAVVDQAPNFPANQSGRRELADWIASPTNPLTARVYVNRAWHWLMGKGIVRTVDNFGLTGETPSHPELLDALAANFLRDGWSTKTLVRSIVLTKTYQRSSRADAALVAADPENRLFGRADRRRLEAESLRDAMLAVGGNLDRTPAERAFAAGLASDYGYKLDSSKRSIYLPYFRNAMPEMLAIFNAADTSISTGARSTGTVAPQALFLTNHPFPATQAKLAGVKLLAMKLPDDEARIHLIYRETLQRDPTPGERAAIKRHLTANPGNWAGVYHAVFASADFRYVD